MTHWKRVTANRSWQADKLTRWHRWQLLISEFRYRRQSWQVTEVHQGWKYTPIGHDINHGPITQYVKAMQHLLSQWSHSGCQTCHHCPPDRKQGWPQHHSIYKIYYNWALTLMGNIPRSPWSHAHQPHTMPCQNQLYQCMTKCWDEPLMLYTMRSIEYLWMN